VNLSASVVTSSAISVFVISQVKTHIELTQKCNDDKKLKETPLFFFIIPGMSSMANQIQIDDFSEGIEIVVCQRKVLFFVFVKSKIAYRRLQGQSNSSSVFSTG